MLLIYWKPRGFQKACFLLASKNIPVCRPKGLVSYPGLDQRPVVCMPMNENLQACNHHEYHSATVFSGSAALPAVSATEIYDGGEIHNLSFYVSFALTSGPELSRKYVGT